MGWRDIKTAPRDANKILIWCADINSETGNPIGTVFAQVRSGNIIATGMFGDWTFTHWRPDPDPPSSKPKKQKYPDDFEAFWAAYPKREGGNPKEPAFKKWKARLKSDVEKEEMLAGARGYAFAMRGKDAQYVAMAQTWIGQARWEQYAAQDPQVRQQQEPQAKAAQSDNLVKIGWRHNEELYDFAARWKLEQEPDYRCGDFVSVPQWLVDEFYRR